MVVDKERIRKELEKTRYGRKFVRTRAFLHMLEEFPELFRGKKYVKEISEAWSVRNFVKRTLNDSTDEWVVVDTGSGLGYFTILTALFHPDTKVYAVDTCTDFSIKDFRGLKNAERRELNIFSEEFKEFLCSFKRVIMVGIHLCSNLATRFIELANEVESVKCAVLVPCCIGKREKLSAFSFLENTYEMWCSYLISKVDRGKFKVISTRDENILSPKNVVIKMRERN